MRALTRPLQILLLLFGLGIGLLSCSEPADTAVPRLIKELKAKDSRTRIQAAQALADYGPDAEKAVRPLIAALRDRNMGVQTYAAVALRAIDTPEARRALDKATKAKRQKKTGS